MPKPNKSSASSGTRKKHAKKSTKGEDDGEDGHPPKQQQKLQRGQKKLKKGMPKIKEYIPPPKPPAPPIPDPLDGLGLARTLPAELVVVLRRLGKKDDVTRRKGLEELRDVWITDIMRTRNDEDDEIEREIKEVAVLSAIPVWMHNLASLLQSPFHRSTALQLHADILAVPALRSSVLESLSLSLLPGTQVRDIIGSWMVAALEEGRRSGGIGLKSWDASTTWSAIGEGETSSEAEKVNMKDQLPSLIEYLALSILDPATLHDNIHPAPVAIEPIAPQISKKPPTKGNKGKPVPAAVSRQVVAIPAAEDDELVEERSARYCVGGLLGLTWLLQQLSKLEISLSEDLSKLLQNPALWYSLSPESSDTPELTSETTTAQPPIRRATYTLLGVVVETFPAALESGETLQTVGDSVLGSCWVEKDAVVWETAGPAVARFLRRWPACWTPPGSEPSRRPSQQPSSASADGEGEDEDSQSSEDEDTASLHEDAGETSSPTTTSSPYYGNFLEFISTICPTIPHLTYPILLVVISTLPTDLLPLNNGPSTQLQNLFSHLWAPVDARLLSTHSLPGQQSAFQAFLQAALDITVLLSTKSLSLEEGKDTARWLVREQLGQRAWREGILTLGGKAGGRRAVKGANDETEAAAFGRALGRLISSDIEIVGDVETSLRDSLVESCLPIETTEGSATLPTILPRSLPLLTALRASTEIPEVVELADQLTKAVALSSAQRLPTALTTSPSLALAIAEAFVDLLRRQSHLMEESVKQELVSLIESDSTSLVGVLSPGLFVSLVELVAADSESQSQDRCRHTLLALLQSSDVEQNTRFAIATSLLNSDETVLLGADSLDHIATAATEIALATNSTEATAVVTGTLKTASYISSDALDTILALICTTIHNSTEETLTTDSGVTVTEAAFHMFTAYATNHLEKVMASDLWFQSLIAIHHMIFLIPRLGGQDVTTSHVGDHFTGLWVKAALLSDGDRHKLMTEVWRSLSDAIQRVEVHVDPSIIIDTAMATTLGPTKPPSAQEMAHTLLPSATQLAEEISRHTAQAPSPSLAIVDTLITYTSEEAVTNTLPSTFDTLGRSKAARLAEAVIALLRTDRRLVNSQPALLQLALSAMELSQDALAVPGSSRGFLTASVPPDQLSTLVREVEGALSYALTSVDEAPLSWHKDTVQLLKAETVPSDADLLQNLLSTLKNDIVANGGDVSARVFRDVLSRHLRQSGAGEAEGEIWLAYAMSLIGKVPQLALGIILAIKPLLLENKAFETAQNRLASELTGIRATQVAERGLTYLRLLIASAPPADAAATFIPQRRALFALQHVASWFTSDDADDLPDELEYRVAELYTTLAPIVQDVSGGHWDSIFDLVESGLESSSLQDTSTYCLLYQSLLLLQQIRDICQSNKSLRASWTMKDTHMKLVLDLFLQCRAAETIPLQLTQGLILELLPDVSDTVMENASLAQLCNLLKLSTSSSIQSAAHRIMSRVIKHQTVALVLEIEASVADAEEGHTAKTIELPSELADIAAQGLNLDWHGDLAIPTILGQLFAWMAILDHFEDASRTLRWAYLDQLSTSKLLTDGLLPMLFAMLGISEVGAWNFPASQYAVDEFYPDLLDPEELPDLVPLASHLFYRALVTIPSALRGYYESLKDRQLQISMIQFVSRNYSPIIIAHEFSELRKPASMAQLTEEGLQVRIYTTQATGSSTGSAEAVASYTVDEQPMEIGIKLPAEFPLKGVEIKDLKRVGVPENKWRGWLMSVQQTITSRNGLILEALTIFKKNVSLHFEGVVECAICYSIISLTDRTLPTKPCRTCKNRFHASCLFKWFNSSHSSSCPMCRSLF